MCKYVRDAPARRRCAQVSAEEAATHMKDRVVIVKGRKIGDIEL